MNTCSALGAFGRISLIFLREDGDEVDVVLLSRGIQSMLQLLCRGVRTWKSGYYFHEPLVFDSHVFAVRACRRRVFFSLRSQL